MNTFNLISGIASILGLLLSVYIALKTASISHAVLSARIIQNLESLRASIKIAQSTCSDFPSASDQNLRGFKIDKYLLELRNIKSKLSETAHLAGTGAKPTIAQFEKAIQDVERTTNPEDQADRFRSALSKLDDLMKVISKLVDEKTTGSTK